MSGSAREVEQGGGFAGRTLGVFVAWAGASAWRRAALLLLICCALFLPGLAGHGVTDRDEGRFVQASKQMMEAGDYVDIRFQDEPRHQKPVGIYWAQTAVANLVGGPDAPIWAYRAPSFIGAVLAVLLTAWAARPLIGARGAFIAAAMMAGVLVLSFEARTAKTDAALLAAVVAAQGALARLWFGVKDDPKEHGWNVFYFWTALAVGALLKGPIIFMPVGGALLWMCAYDRSLKGLTRLGAGWGLVWFFLLAAPWYVAIGVKTGGEFFGASIGTDLGDKIGGSRERPALPPGAHLLAFFGTFWPWTVLALLAAPFAWRWRRAPETAFLLGWLIPTWIVFELIGTKLPHYTLIVFPAIAAITAAAAIDGAAQPKGWLFWTGATLWAIPALALPLAFGLGPTALAGAPHAPSLIGGAVALMFLIFAWRWLLAGVWLGFFRAALVGAGVLYATAYQFSFPALEPIWISERAVAAAAPLRACVAKAQGAATPATLGAVRYHEPSLVFLAGSDTKLLRPKAAAAWLAETDGALVWIARRADDRRQRPDEMERVRTAMAEKGASFTILTQIEGFQYNGGRRLLLSLVARDDDPLVGPCREG